MLQAVRWLRSTAKAVARSEHKAADVSALADHILVMLDLKQQLKLVCYLRATISWVV